MFYFFHHMPKCGGTSFNAFLRSIFTVHRDYHLGNAQSHPKAFQKYRSAPLDLAAFGPEDCVAGHYNMPGIYLWERYPDLFGMEKRMFTILRDPYEAAESGVRFGIKRGWYNAAASDKQKNELLLRRTHFISKAMGVTDEAQIPEVLDRYWFVAPLEQIAQAARILETETGKTGAPVERINVTELEGAGFSQDIREQFRHRAALDFKLYDAAVRRFETFLAGSPASE